MHAKDRSHFAAAYWFAGGLVAAALFSMAPAAMEVAYYAQYREVAGSPGIARWALVLLLLGIVQTAYGVYLFQLPDRASLFVVALWLTAVAGIYALGLGMTLVADPGGALTGPSGLQWADKLAGGKASLWCLCMTSLSTILAFFAGRLSIQWRRAEQIRRSAGL